MPRKDGSSRTTEPGITKRGNRYRVRVTGTDPRTSEHRVIHGSFSTLREARDYKRKISHELRAGVYQAPSAEPFGVYLAHWLDSIQAEPNTVKTYERVIRRIIAPELGEVPLGQLNGRQIQDLYNVPRGKSLAIQLQAVVSGALKLAVIEGEIPRNVAEGLRAKQIDPEDASGAPAIWDPAELATFLDAVQSHPLAPLFSLAVKTGMRLHELCDLQWCDITFDLARVFVQRGKTDAARRRISIDTETVTMLRLHRAEQEARRATLGDLWTNLDYVFDRGMGERVSPRTVESVMERLVAKLGLSELTPHGLRHIHATYLLRAGVPVHVVSKRLGHASPEVTLKIYAHVLPDDETDVARMLGDVLSISAETAIVQLLSSSGEESRESAS